MGYWGAGEYGELPDIYSRVIFGGTGIANDKSYSVGLQLQYQYKENCMIRFRTVVNKFNTSYVDTTYLGSQSTFQFVTQNNIQTTYIFAPGVFWKINNNKLSIYSGIEAQIKFQGKYVYQSIANNFINDTLSSTGSITDKIDGGKSFGIGGSIGFNYHLLKKLSLGSEFSSALTYYKVDGKVVEENLAVGVQGNVLDKSTTTRILKGEYFKILGCMTNCIMLHF